LGTSQDNPVFRHGPIARLEALFVGDVRAFAVKDPRDAPWFLVPSRHLRRRLRRRLAEAGIPTFDLRFVLFPDLAGAILDRTVGDDTLRSFPPGGERLLLEAVVRNAVGPDHRFRPILDHGGFLSALARSLDELSHAGVDAERFAAESAGGAPDRAALAGLYAAVRSRHHDCGMETTSARIQRAAERTDRLPGNRVWIYGFYDLTGVQRRMVRRLAGTHAVRAYVPSVTGPGEEWGAERRAWFTAAGFREIPDEEAPEPAPPAPLRVFSAAGERREAEEAVRRVLAALRDGVPPERIAVLYRHAEPYRDLLVRLFARAGIPLGGDDPPPLARARAARAFRLLVRAARSRASRRAVMDFLDAAAPLSPAIPESEAAAWAARWEVWTIEAGITRGRDVWTSRLARIPEPAEGSPDRRALAVLRERVPELLDRMDGLARHDRWSDLCGRLAALGDDWLGRDPGWPAVRDVVDDLGRLDAVGEPASPGVFEALLEERLASEPEPRAEERRARVFVGSVSSARGLAFDRLFLLGLTERVFPRPVRQDPLLPDRERERIRGLEGTLPLRRDAPGEEAFLFALTLAAAPERTLSWSRIEPAEARPRVPSAFLLDAVSRDRGMLVDDGALDAIADRVPLDRLVPAGRIAAERPEDPVPHDPARRIDAWNAIDAAEFDRLVAAGAVGAGRFDRLAGLSSPGLRRSVLRHDLRWRTPYFTPADGVLESETALAALERRIGGRAWSASGLETYADCPYRFFVEKVLGVERLEPPESLDRITPLDRGSLIHAVLRRFLAEHGGDLAAGAASGDGRARLKAALAEVCRRETERVGAVTPVGFPLTWSVDAQRLADDLGAWLDFELDRPDPLRPEAFELAFGGRADPDDTDRRSTGVPVTLDLPSAGETEFQGRIDRVDLDAAGTRARVTDYKTGRKYDSAEEVGVEGGLHLQLPIYLLALTRFFPDVTRAEAEYLYLGPDPQRMTYRPPTFPAAPAELAETLDILLAGIRAGRFFAWPDRAGRCRTCRYRSICGPGIEDRFALKKGDLRVQDQLRLRGALEDGEDA